MSAGAYLKQAAANLRRAALERHREVDAIRKEVINKEVETRKKITKLREETIRLTGLMTLSGHDNTDRSQLLNEMQQIQQEISDLETQLQEERDRLNKEAADKENDTQGLNKKASELESQASQG